jgi:hypothetical protein
LRLIVVQYSLNFSQEAERGALSPRFCRIILTAGKGLLPVIEAPGSTLKGILDPQGTIVILIAR